MSNHRANVSSNEAHLYILVNKRFKTSLKTTLKRVATRLMSSWQRLSGSGVGPQSGPVDPVHGRSRTWELTPQSRPTSLFFRTLVIGERAGQGSLLSSIRRRRLAIFGHIRHLPKTTQAHTALELVVSGRTPSGESSPGPGGHAPPPVGGLAIFSPVYQYYY